MRTTTPLRLVVIILASVAFVFFLRNRIIERISVATASMEPTMPVDSRWWQDKITLLWRRPRQGDVIVFNSPLDPDKQLIKRVIAGEGDSVAIKNKKVYVNGAPLQEPYARYNYGETLFEGDNLGPYKIPGAHVFVLGDNRDLSEDSRDWRDPNTARRILFIPLEMVKGRVLWVSSKP